MPTEWIDVVDTAVKIGLGATISGIAGHFAYKHQQKNDREKEIKRVRKEMLLLAVEKTDEYFQYLSDYFSRIDGLVLSKEQYANHDGYWDEAKAWLQASEDKLLDARGCVYVAQSRLQLLGYTEILDALSGVRKLENSLRKFYLGLPESKELPTQHLLASWAEQFNLAKVEFQQRVSAEFIAKCL